MIAELFAFLIASTIASSVAIVVVLALRDAVRTAFGASAAYLLWIAVPLAVLATWIPAPVVPVIALVRAPTSLVAAMLHSDVAATPLDMRPFVIAAWLAGVVATMALLAMQQRRYVRSLGHLVRDGEGVVRATADPGLPALIGALCPRIVLPSDFERRYAPRERELILAHERAHRARGDAQVNALVALARCVHWFNPLVHVAASCLRFDQELACDANVIRRFPEARRPYADAMLKTQLAEVSRQELRLPVGCRWPSGHPLKERIHMLKKPMPTRARSVLGTAFATLLATGGAYATWSMQPARASAVVERPASEDATFRIDAPPQYPARAIAARVAGDVMLTVHVRANGEPASAEIATIDPPDATSLGDAAIAAVMKWRFNPAMRDGVAVAGDVNVPVAFRLSDDGDGGATSADPPPPPAPPPPAPPPPPWPDLPADAAHTSYRKLTPPTYPKSSIDAKIEGVVYVDASIDATGAVTGARVDHVEPPIASVLGHAATEAVRQWTFNAPMQQGKAVAAHAIVPMRFALRDPDAVQLSEIPAGALDIIDVVAEPVETASPAGAR